jgi:hypothetical protein
VALRMPYAQAPAAQCTEADMQAAPLERAACNQAPAL